MPGAPQLRSGGPARTDTMDLSRLGFATAALPAVGALLGALTPMLLNAVAGIAAGALALLAVLLARKLIGRVRGRKVPKAGSAV